MWDGTTDVLPDADGDGLPDMRDLCPNDSTMASGALVRDGQHVDSDGDYVGDDCDPHPGVCEHLDSDGDGLPDDLDPCPFVAVPGGAHSDRDGDGLGDECDNCPDAPNAGQEDRDDDGRGDVCDNCLEQFNPSQTNCNAEAEEEVNRRREAAMMDPLPLLGDACDPVPCAETQVRAWEEHTRDATVIRMDEVAFDALVGTTARDGRTNLRFCRCSAVAGNTAGDRLGCVLRPVGGDGLPIPGEGGCTLLDIAAYDDSVALEQAPWRWTTHRLVDAPPSPPSSCITDADCRASEQCRSGGCRCRVPGLCPRPATPEVVNPELAATYAAPTGSFEEDRRTRWLLYEQDVPRWRDTVLVAGERFEAHRVPGVVWTHTPGWVGEASFDAVPGLGAEFRQRASYYWSGGVSAPIVRPPVREPFPCFEPIVPFVGSAEVCPLCPFHTPEPWLVFPALTACFDIRIDRPRLLLGRVMLEPQPGLELSGLELFAEDPGPWVAAAEVGSWLPSAGLRYVKLEEGARMTRLLLEQGGSFVDPQLQCPPQQPCGPATGFGLAAASSPEGAPAPRQGHASVLSATREALWVLGGRALEDGRELRDAWRLDVRSGTWMRLTLPPSYVPGRILAATYSAVDQRLWVLDEREESGERVARLVRVPPEGGGAQLVASWPRRSRNEGFALAADPYGALWVAGWPTSGRVHAVLRLERRTATTWAVSGWDLGVGRLVDGGVRANARGVSVLAQVREGRGPSLEFHATSELRSGPGGESACF